MTDPRYYMHRCLELAQLGLGHVAPNPLVGAVLVHGQRIIGEGYHQQYGGLHAEPNCLQSVLPADRHLIPESTLYVNLEPCAHFGKTPPCANLLIQERVPKVVVGCRDPFPQVDGKGIERMVAAGIIVETGLLEAESRQINRRFFRVHQQHRPYFILKWAQTANGIIGAAAGRPRLQISTPVSNRLVHRWRSEEAAILVGTNTAAQDNPRLNNRLWVGPSPVRVVLDRQLRLPEQLNLFQNGATWVFNNIKTATEGNRHYYQLDQQGELAGQICRALQQLNIQSVLVEGGRQLLQTLLDAGCWDEARIITSPLLAELPGTEAPKLTGGKRIFNQQLDVDSISIFQP